MGMEQTKVLNIFCENRCKEIILKIGATFKYFGTTEI